MTVNTNESFVAVVLRELAGVDTKKEGAYTTLFKGAKAHNAMSFEAICAEAEERFKESTKATRMPSSWRTAKSNIMWGLKNEENGQPIIQLVGSYSELLNVKKALGSKDKAEETASKAEEKADAAMPAPSQAAAIQETTEAALAFLESQGHAIAKLYSALAAAGLVDIAADNVDLIVATLADKQASTQTTTESKPARKRRAA